MAADEKPPIDFTIDEETDGDFALVGSNTPSAGAPSSVTASSNPFAKRVATPDQTTRAPTTPVVGTPITPQPEPQRPRAASVKKASATASASPGNVFSSFAHAVGSKVGQAIKTASSTVSQAFTEKDAEKSLAAATQESVLKTAATVEAIGRAYGDMHVSLSKARSSSAAVGQTLDAQVARVRGESVVDESSPAPHVTTMMGSARRVGSVSAQLDAVYDETLASLLEGVIRPMKTLHQDIGDLKPLKREFEKATSAYNAACATLTAAEARNDPIKILAATSEVQRARTRVALAENAMMTESTELRIKEDLDIAEASLAYLKIQARYFERCSQIMQTALVDVDEAVLLQRRRDFAEAKTGRLNMMHQQKIHEFDDKIRRFADLLCAPGFQLLHAVVEGQETSTVEKAYDAMIRTLDGQKIVIPVVNNVVRSEVAETSEVGTLFRGSSSAVRLMSAFTRIVGGAYLRGVLGKHISAVCAAQLSFEVDPNRAPPGEDAAGNLIMLKGHCDVYLSEIFASIDKMPMAMRVVCKILQQEVVKRFPEAKYTALGGYLFLRYFCPAIVSPHSYGLVDAPPEPGPQRCLVLISKTLQNLCNNVRYGAKEAYMNDMNAFLEEQQPLLRTFFDAVVTIPDDADIEPLFGTEFLRQDMVFFADLIRRDVGKVVTALQANGGEGMIPLIYSSVAELSLEER